MLAVMSIGRRLFNMARSELSSLLDSAVDAERGRERSRDVEVDADEDLYRKFSLDQLSDAELEAEIERRYKARQQAAHSAHARPTRDKPGTGAQSARGPSSTGQASGSGHAGSRGQTAGGGHARKPSSTSPDDELRLAYAALEVPFGTDFANVRKSYRQLMRKYHPDRHTGSPDKQKAATELAQRLSQAYELIEKRSRG
jgi:DnaJ-class molecular chaperone